MEKETKIEFKLPLLTDTTFSRWKYDIKIILEARSLWTIVQGKEKPPNVPQKRVARVDTSDMSKDKAAHALQAAQAQLDNEYAAAVVEYKKDLKEWNVKDARAREVLTRSMDERHHQMIRSCVTAAHMFKITETLYEQKTSSNIFLATREFHALKWTADMKAMSFVADMRASMSKLEALGEPISDAMMIAKLINELPESFSSIRESWEISMIAGAELSVQDLLSQLIKVERNRAEQAKNKTQENESRSEAFTASKGPGSFPGNCFNCGKQGHSAARCFAPGGGREGQGPDNRVQETKPKRGF